MLTLDEETKGYVAGFLDGEGCFSIGKTWKVAVTAANTNRDVIVWLQSLFGGSVSGSTRKKKPHHRRVWQWSLVGRDAAALCRVLAPYLREKAPQALILVHVQATTKSPKIGRKLDPVVVEERQHLKDILTALKRIES